jgi:PAS domain S-box-containing protein
MFLGVLLFYWSNRNPTIPGWVTSGLFLVFLLVLFLFIDTPDQLAGGRSLFVFTIPIIMASILLYPATSFIFALFVAMEIWYLSLQIDLVPDLFAMIGFFLVALVSWLSARNMEQALREVRLVNKELDQRVADRTQDLSEALTRESEQASQRQAILQGIADGVMVFDTDGKVTLTNPALIRLLELPLDKVLNRNLAEVVQSSKIESEDREMILRSMGYNEATLAPMRVKWGVRTLSIIAAPVRDPKGRAIGNVAVMRDFTREAEVEQMKNTFVAMVSHELRTPLNAILGYSEMLRDGFYGSVNEKQANTADRILNNSSRLLNIVSDLLDQARIEAGKLKFDYKPFHSGDLTDNLHSVMDKIAHDKGLELTSRIDANMPEQLTGDTHRLQQVLVNLVNNAVKFTDTGSVDVYVYKVNEQHWGFDVTDTGQGIAPDDQKHVFDPFRQLEGTVTRSHGGIGLGLAIVKRLVELMGGQVFLKSAVGQGSAFTIILPFEPPRKEEKEGEK